MCPLRDRNTPSSLSLAVDGDSCLPPVVKLRTLCCLCAGWGAQQVVVMHYAGRVHFMIKLLNPPGHEVYIRSASGLHSVHPSHVTEINLLHVTQSCT